MCLERQDHFTLFPLRLVQQPQRGLPTPVTASGMPCHLHLCVCAPRRWSGHSSDAGAGAIRMSKKSNTGRPLQDMLQIMLEESDARLPPGFIMVDTLGKYCTSYPSRDKLIAELKSRGFAAARWVKSSCSEQYHSC